jgi:hypothetical protein
MILDLFAKISTYLSVLFVCPTQLSILPVFFWLWAAGLASQGIDVLELGNVAVILLLLLSVLAKVKARDPRGRRQCLKVYGGVGGNRSLDEPPPSCNLSRFSMDSAVFSLQYPCQASTRRRFSFYCFVFRCREQNNRIRLDSVRLRVNVVLFTLHQLVCAAQENSFIVEGRINYCANPVSTLFQLRMKGFRSFDRPIRIVFRSKIRDNTLNLK